LPDASAAGRQSDSTSRAMNNFVWIPLASIDAQEYKFYLSWRKAVASSSVFLPSLLSTIA
jgi:hypothetical protein